MIHQYTTLHRRCSSYVLLETSR